MLLRRHSLGHVDLLQSGFSHHHDEGVPHSWGHRRFLRQPRASSSLRPGGADLDRNLGLDVTIIEHGDQLQVPAESKSEATHQLTELDIIEPSPI